MFLGDSSRNIYFAWPIAPLSTSWRNLPTQPQGRHLDTANNNATKISWLNLSGDVRQHGRDKLI